MSDSPEANADIRYRLGLIGFPIGHSLSPALFREYFSDRPEILSSYTYELVERSDFGEAYSVFLRDFLAVNVTAPFKEDAFRAASCHDRSAAICLASNLLVKRRTGDREEIWAYNTDFMAVHAILEDEFGKGSGNALVIGCGGAGKAAAAAACEAGMRVCICNRTEEKAERFAGYLAQSYGRSVYAVHQEMLEESVRKADVVIYTLPVALAGIADETGIFRGKTVVEASYSSPVLSGVSCRHYVPGTEWLRGQAVATYRIVIGE